MSGDYTKNTPMSRLQHTTSLLLIRAEHMSLMDSNSLIQYNNLISLPLN